MVLGVTATSEPASPIAKQEVPTVQEVAAELELMLAAAEVQAKVQAWLDPCPSSSCPGQVLHDDMLM
jgi:hypothetical protein